MRGSAMCTGLPAATDGSTTARFSGGRALNRPGTTPLHQAGKGILGHTTLG
jgi:hypothetical protein